jgi:hypothetical protein
LRLDPSAGYSITEQIFREPREMARLCGTLAGADVARTKAGAQKELNS